MPIFFIFLQQLSSLKDWWITIAMENCGYQNYPLWKPGHSHRFYCHYLLLWMWKAPSTRMQKFRWSAFSVEIFSMVLWGIYAQMYLKSHKVRQYLDILYLIARRGEKLFETYIFTCFPHMFGISKERGFPGWSQRFSLPNDLSPGNTTLKKGFFFFRSPMPSKSSVYMSGT